MFTTANRIENSLGPRRLRFKTGGDEFGIPNLAPHPVKNLRSRCLISEVGMDLDHHWQIDNLYVDS